MKIFNLALSFIFIILVISCKKERVNPSSITGSEPEEETSIVGKWFGFEFIGDDGLAYGINQFIPWHDSSSVPGCVVIDFQESIIEKSYEFTTDSIFKFYYQSTDQYRFYQVLNGSTCQIDYQSWITTHYLDSSIYKYAEIPNSRIEIWQDGSSSNKDTINYSITNGVLTISDNQRDKYRQ